MLKSFGEIGPTGPKKNENTAQDSKYGCDRLKMASIGIVFTAMSKTTQ